MPLPKADWDEAYHKGIACCGAFVKDKMIGCACVEKYSEDAWEVADVRIRKLYRNQGYVSRLCSFVLSYILSQGKIATIRTVEAQDLERIAGMLQACQE